MCRLRIFSHCQQLNPPDWFNVCSNLHFNSGWNACLKKYFVPEFFPRNGALFQSLPQTGATFQLLHPIRNKMFIPNFYCIQILKKIFFARAAPLRRPCRPAHRWAPAKGAISKVQESTKGKPRAQVFQCKVYIVFHTPRNARFALKK